MTTQSDKLMPCPFCGTALQSDDITKPPFPFSTVCPKCQAYGPEADSRAEAIAAWNTRQSLLGWEPDSVRCAVTLFNSLKEREGRYVAVKVDGPLNWTITEPRTEEALLDALKTDG